MRDARRRLPVSWSGDTSTSMRQTPSRTATTPPRRGRLVLPIQHRPTLLDLADDEATQIMQVVIHVARAIDETEERPGIAVWQNNGVPAHQTIPHVHFHVAGTLPGGGTEFGPVAELSLDETERIAARLRPHLTPRFVS
ncbi:MAG: HIT family protein [Acidimicrobiales bacterium]